LLLRVHQHTNLLRIMRPLVTTFTNLGPLWSLSSLPRHYSIEVTASTPCKTPSASASPPTVETAAPLRKPASTSTTCHPIFKPSLSFERHRSNSLFPSAIQPWNPDASHALLS
jgi:hypothetical protein